jgi:hypothetical protein
VLTISEFFFNGYFVTISEIFLMDFMCRADFAINMAFYKKIKLFRAYSLYRVFTFCYYIEYCRSGDKMPKIHYSIAKFSTGSQGTLMNFLNDPSHYIHLLFCTPFWSHPYSGCVVFLVCKFPPSCTHQSWYIFGRVYVQYPISSLF